MSGISPRPNRPLCARFRQEAADTAATIPRVMKILHVSNLRFNRRWYRWLQEHAPRHDLLVIAGNLVDHRHHTSLDSQRRWVIEWLRDCSRPLCVASGPEDREFDPQANQWRPARWLLEAKIATRCVDDGFMEMGGFSVHCIGHGELPADRFADIYVVHHAAHQLQSESAHGGQDASVIAEPAVDCTAGARAILCGELVNSGRWQWTEHGALYLNPGSSADARFPNHVVFDPTTMAALRVQATDYIPRIDVVGIRSIARTLGEAGDPALVELGS